MLSGNDLYFNFGSTSKINPLASEMVTIESGCSLWLLQTAFHFTPFNFTGPSNPFSVSSNSASTLAIAPTFSSGAGSGQTTFQFFISACSSLAISTSSPYNPTLRNIDLISPTNPSSMVGDMKSSKNRMITMSKANKNRVSVIVVL